jgi:UDP-N-acetyl-D-mannosaminuronate dehydrogenase
MCTLRFIGWLAGACAVAAALGYLLDPAGTVGATAQFTDEAGAAYLSATQSMSSMDAPTVIAPLGLTFTSNTDDMRYAPALPLIAALQAHGARVRAHDPVGMGNASRLVQQVVFAEDAYACATGAHAAVLVTDWVQFRHLDLDRLRSLMADPVVVDLRNLYHPADMRKAGLIYVGVGREACPRRTAIVSEAAE